MRNATVDVDTHSPIPIELGQCIINRMALREARPILPPPRDGAAALSLGGGPIARRPARNLRPHEGMAVA